jgi:putative endonuclease
MVAAHLESGARAEQRAAEYLEARGVCILARNLRCRRDELDIVGLDGDILALIEVRQRRGHEFGGALASVTHHKQRKLIRAARYLLQRDARLRGRRLRFDVLAVQGCPDGAHEIAWIKDAFRPA